MKFVYFVNLRSLGKDHCFGPYQSIRKAREVFELVYDIAPEGSDLSIIDRVVDE